jgi:hypothetical protein
VEGYEGESVSSLNRDRDLGEDGSYGLGVEKLVPGDRGSYILMGSMVAD